MEPLSSVMGVIEVTQVTMRMFLMVPTNQAKQGGMNQEGFQGCSRQCPGRKVVQGEGDNGNKNMSQNNYYIVPSSYFFEREL